MDDIRALAARVKAVIPAEPLKPTRYWVGILPPELDLQGPVETTDILWVKASSRIAVQQLHEAYGRSHHYQFDLADLEGRVLPFEVTVPNLNRYGTSVIPLKAIPRVLRAPLQETPGQTRANLKPSNPLKSDPDTENVWPTQQAPEALFSGEQETHTTSQAHVDNNVWAASSDHLADNGTPVLEAPSHLSETSPITHSAHSALPTFKMETSSAMSCSTPMPYQDDTVEALDSAIEQKQPFHLPQDVAEPLQFASDGRSISERGDFLQEESAADLEGHAKDFEYADEEFHHDSLRQLLTEDKPETLEKGVESALRILKKLKPPLAPFAETLPDAHNWIENIERLEQTAVKTRTVVGVFGNTGAGKSSVINAMLDEERLVPTNCMRACTAVVTELSWNDNDDPDKRYRAEIEFLKPEDWAKEMETLFSDMLDGEGNLSRDYSNPDTEAGIAFAKFKAVYPNKTREQLAASSVQGLMNVPAVRDLLGTVREIECSDPFAFYRRLHYYVDSKEKATGKKKGDKTPRAMEFWPLIKVVKIYTKSSALSTGAVIVDLPGVQDSNAARAAVAESYKKQCTGLWIVSPINRAVDDKAAKSLLGDTFKRQLQYDGTYSSVTFICSKTDDISITEAADSLGLTEEISGSAEECEDIDQRIEDLKERVRNLKEEIGVFREILEDADDQFEEWEKLKDALESGETVYAPKSNKRKRTASKEPTNPRKKRLASEGSECDGDFIEVSDDSDRESSRGEEDEDEKEEGEKEEGEERGEPLTAEAIEEKLTELRQHRRQARANRGEHEAQIREANKNIRAYRERLAELRAEMSAKCIAGRNEYSKGAIQQDFAAGIKELDQEQAQERNEDEFDPEQDLRDYDEVARSLPVFCVSSRAYQKLSGRLTKDAPVTGFSDVEETEIPQLQAHCKKLTEAGRASSCRAFLTNLNNLLNSMYLWSDNHVRGIKLSGPDKGRELRILARRLEDLEEELKRTVSHIVTAMKNELTTQIFDRCTEGITKAINSAVDTSRHWGARRDEGGLLWATYKATVRRNGVYSGASGPRDFNQELIDPLTKHLAMSWERAFQRSLPAHLNTYKQASTKALEHFHNEVENRARQHGAGLAGLNLLRTQLRTYHGYFDLLVAQLREQMNNLQREANRAFLPVVSGAMEQAYHICAEERGPGSYARMKQAMVDHVENHKHSMFAESTHTVRAGLDDMCTQLKRTMNEQASRTYEAMQRDYMNVLGGGAQLPPGMMLPAEERELRKQVRAVLKGVDEVFRKVIAGELDEEAEAAEAQGATQGEEGGDQNAEGILQTEDGDFDGSVARNEDDQTETTGGQPLDNETGPEDIASRPASPITNQSASPTRLDTKAVTPGSTVDEGLSSLDTQNDRVVTIEEEI